MLILKSVKEAIIRKRQKNREIPMTVTRNKLSRSDFFKLAKYIEYNQKDFTYKKSSTVAAMASTALGFYVTQANVANAAADIGVSWEQSRTSLTPAAKERKTHQKTRTLARVQHKIIESLSIHLDEKLMVSLLEICEFPPKLDSEPATQHTNRTPLFGHISN